MKRKLVTLATTVMTMIMKAMITTTTTIPMKRNMLIR